MSATRRGVSLHAILESLETARKRLRAMHLSPNDCDRVAYVMAMMLNDRKLTAEQVYADVNRLHPREATQQAGADTPPTNTKPKPISARK